jgi:hypothetical protein
MSNEYPMYLLRQDSLRVNGGDTKTVGEDITFHSDEEVLYFMEHSVEREMTFSSPSGFLGLSSVIVTKKLWVLP